MPPLYNAYKTKLLIVLHSKLYKEKKRKMISLSWASCPFWRKVVYFHGRPAHAYSHWSIFTGDLPTQKKERVVSLYWATYPGGRMVSLYWVIYPVKKMENGLIVMGDLPKEKGKSGLIVMGNLPKWKNNLIVMGDLPR